MVNSWTTVRRHGRERAASPTVSRLIVMVFLAAAAMGLMSGAAWMVWTSIRRSLGG